MCNSLDKTFSNYSDAVNYVKEQKKNQKITITIEENWQKFHLGTPSNL